MREQFKRRDLVLGFLGTLLVTGIMSFSMNEEFEQKVESFDKPKVILLGEETKDDFKNEKTSWRLVNHNGQPAIEIKKIRKL